MGSNVGFLLFSSPVITRMDAGFLVGHVSITPLAATSTEITRGQIERVCVLVGELRVEPLHAQLYRSRGRARLPRVGYEATISGNSLVGGHQDKLLVFSTFPLLTKGPNRVIDGGDGPLVPKVIFVLLVTFISNSAFNKRSVTAAPLRAT